MTAGRMMPPSAAITGQRARTEGRKVADGELALDLQPDDEEEDRQQPVVDPVEQR